MRRAKRHLSANVTKRQGKPLLRRAFRDRPLRSRDTLVVWLLNRLGRGLRHLIELIAELEPVTPSWEARI